MGSHLNIYDILLQQGRKDSTSDAFVLHKILEHGIVDGVCNGHHNSSVFIMINDGTKIERKNGTAKQIDRRFHRFLRFFCWGSKKKRSLQ